MIFEALQSELLRFKFHFLNSKIPEFSLNIENPRDFKVSIFPSDSFFQSMVRYGELRNMKNVRSHGKMKTFSVFILEMLSKGVE